MAVEHDRHICRKRGKILSVSGRPTSDGPALKSSGTHAARLDVTTYPALFEISPTPHRLCATQQDHLMAEGSNEKNASEVGV